MVSPFYVTNILMLSLYLRDPLCPGGGASCAWYHAEQWNLCILRSRYGLMYAGNDLNEDRTPIEAGLTWTIGKRRREACDFLGGEVRVQHSDIL